MEKSKVIDKISKRALEDFKNDKRYDEPDFYTPDTYQNWLNEKAECLNIIIHGPMGTCKLCFGFNAKEIPRFIMYSRIED